MGISTSCCRSPATSCRGVVPDCKLSGDRNRACDCRSSYRLHQWQRTAARVSLRLRSREAKYGKLLGKHNSGSRRGQIVLAPLRAVGCAMARVIADPNGIRACPLDPLDELCNSKEVRLIGVLDEADISLLKSQRIEARPRRAIPSMPQLQEAITTTSRCARDDRWIATVDSSPGWVWATGRHASSSARQKPHR